MRTQLVFYLISIHPVEQSHTDNGRPDSSHVGEGCKAGGLHLNILDSLCLEVLKVLHLVSQGVLAERSVQSALPYEAKKLK